VNPTLNVLLFLLRPRRWEGVIHQPGIGNLLDNAEQDGDNYDGFECLPEHDEENWNREHVRHDCLEDVAGRNDDGRGGEGGRVGREEKEGKGEKPSLRGKDGKPQLYITESAVIR
jgi:hypothetical protein